MEKNISLILIQIKLCLTNNNKLSTKYIFREVSLLSRLQHPNIVRYYQSWIEDYELFPNEEEKEESFDITECDNIEEIASQDSVEEAQIKENDKNKKKYKEKVKLIKFYLYLNKKIYLYLFKYIIIFRNKKITLMNFYQKFNKVYIKNIYYVLRQKHSQKIQNILIAISAISILKKKMGIKICK